MNKRKIKREIEIFEIMDPILSVLANLKQILPFGSLWIIIIYIILKIFINIFNSLRLKCWETNYKKRCKQLYYSILELENKYNSNSEKKLKEQKLKYEKTTEKKKDIKKEYKNNVKYIRIYIIILCIISVINRGQIIACIISVINRGQIIAQTYEMTEVSQSLINKESPVIKKDEEETPVIKIEEEEPEKTSPSLPEPEKTPVIKAELSETEETWVKFRLEHPKGYPGISDDEIKKMYNLLFYTSIKEADLDEKMQSEILIWKDQCTYNNPLDGIVTSENKSTQYYTDIESQFSNKNGKIMSSSSLDVVMNGRSELFDICPNGGLMWLLANHNQTYALNYLDQPLDLNQPYTIDIVKSILYFYMKSIYCTQQSLMFETDIETKIKRINYMKLRYKDIADFEILDDYDILNDNIRIRADRIYDAMELNEFE